MDSCPPPDACLSPAGRPLPPAVLASLEAHGRFASRAHLWCFLRFFGIAAEHDHALTAFSQSHGGAPYAVALVSPPDAHRPGRWLRRLLIGRVDENLGRGGLGKC